jgi:hypothetical protein
MSERVRQAADPGSHPRRAWWLWLVVVALLVVAIGFAFSRCGTGSDTAAPPAPAVPSAAPPTTAQAAPSTGGPGRLTAGEALLIPVGRAANGDARLAGQTGQDVTAESVPVESVPLDEGFWIGSSVTDRVYVQLEGATESGYTVGPGDRVSFTGRLVANPPGFVGATGLAPQAGADQLERQGAHVVVDQAALQVVAG